MRAKRPRSRSRACIIQAASASSAMKLPRYRASTRSTSFSICDWLGGAFEIGGELLERPGVEPEKPPVEREASFVQRDRAVLAEQLAQAVQRAGERAVRRVAVDARP